LEASCLAEGTADPYCAAACPEGANCAGALQALAPNPGYWVDRSDYANTYAQMYPCFRNTCPGAQSFSVCWHISAFVHSDVGLGHSHGSPNATAANDSLVAQCSGTNVLCAPGAAGPFCGSCIERHIYSASHNLCKACKEAEAGGFASAGVGISIVALGIIVFALGTAQQRSAINLTPAAAVPK
jgi:hypothetical protein